MMLALAALRKPAGSRDGERAGVRVRIGFRHRVR